MFAASKTDSASTGGYQISRSLRFNSADSAYLNRTPASASNQTTWTWSGWVKRSSLATGANQWLFTARQGGPYFVMGFSGTDTLSIIDSNCGINIATTQVFRDVSAWYHIVLAVDTTQATASNRVKLYLNGLQITSLTPVTYPTQNVNTVVNSAIQHNLSGQWTYGEYFNGYMTEVNFVDGSQLTPSSFGETNADTGVWQPKAYSGSYGTNGFYLNFSDNSNTTAATLGKDYSGNGNNWTPNNFSVTAGAGNDSLVDSPTSYGTDTGVGGTVRGNYCTLNPVDTISTVTLANGNLDYTGSSGLSIATFGVSSGKWYWEHVIGAVNYCVIGIYQSGSKSMGYLGQSGVSIGIPNGGSPQYAGVSAPTGSLSAFTSADTIGFALDLDAGTFTVYKNNVSSLVFSGLTGLWFPAQAMNYSASGIYNFGQRPFAYTAPSGFKALCTQNLPTPTIGATTATQASKYFAPTIYTGNGASPRAVTGVGFQPDLVWMKCRSSAFVNGLFDSVRGTGKLLISNLTVAEISNDPDGYLSSFDSDGFSLTTGSNSNNTFNGNTSTYVAWNWKANGSGSTNTSGSITSTVSANTTSGFSIVTYTGNATSGATIGHGLGVAPSMLIVKSRSAAYGWCVYTASLGATYLLKLDTTAAATNSGVTEYWKNTAPTSSVFTIGNDLEVNASTKTFVAYCFAEVAGYSKFGSYTGNGSTDGTFVYFGFRPAYVMIKASNAVDNWVIMDVARNPYNAVNYWLQAESSAAEATLTPPQFDFNSNGMKLRGTSSTCNGSGVTYIYMAFASNPFKYSLAR
jgi:hypothetical protein